MSRKRVLILCYAFPPFNHVSALRGLKAARAFRDAGWNVTVLRSAFMGAGRDLHVNLEGLSVEEYDPGRMSRALAKTDGDRLARLARSVLRRMIVPEHTWLLRNAVNRSIGKLGGLGAYDAVVSISYPFVLHEICRRRRKAGERFVWIADNRDMWANSPYRGRSLAPRRLLKRIERRCMEECDVATFASETTAEIYGSEYPVSTAVVLNGWDGAKVDHKPWARPIAPDSLTFVHTGSLYNGRRDLRPLVAGLEQLRASHGYRPNLVLAGPDSREAASRLAGASNVDFDGLGQLTRDEAYNVQDKSDFLVLVMEDSWFDTTFTPAKLFEYAFRGKPVIALARADSDVGRLIRRHKLGTATFSAEQIADFVRETCSKGWDGPAHLNELTADFQFAKMVSLAESLVPASG